MTFTTQTPPLKNIVEMILNDEDFSALIAAVKEAGLIDTISSEGPFTFFAPKNAAFSKVGEITLRALHRDKVKLTALLTYHLVPQKILSTELIDMPEVLTVEGSKLLINPTIGIKVGSAYITKADVECSNGVIHVIDTVLRPEQTKETTPIAL